MPGQGPEQGPEQGNDRLAVVLFNLGGPDSPKAVTPFLFNLFNDPAIIGAPGALRWALAWFLSLWRAPVAKAIYDQIGGCSPIVPLTQQQARALERRLLERSDWAEVKVFVAMRYWHPRAHDVAQEVAGFAPAQVVLLPLYPQFSTTTTGSSLKEWLAAANVAGLAAPSVSVCCHFLEEHFIAAHKGLLEAAIKSAGGPESARVLFSAHGLPKRVVEKGDPYRWQVEASAGALVRALGVVDWQICYQSRVGPLEWIGPSTHAEITRAGAEGKAVVVVPIAFVSEHSETLVELHIKYRKLAEDAGVPIYVPVPALGTASRYIEALARITLEAAEKGGGIGPGGAATRRCPAEFGRCPMGEA